MIELMILGFLAESPLHGYELRRRMERLHGHARSISDGTIYPAIKRLEGSGAITAEAADGAGAAPRKLLRLTPTGRDRLLDRLRDVRGHDVSDGSRFAVVLTFLGLLPDEQQRAAVLRRRLEFLDQPASFFYVGDRPLKADDVDDPYRRGVLLTARATSRAERSWLRSMLSSSPTTDAG